MSHLGADAAVAAAAVVAAGGGIYPLKKGDIKQHMLIEGLPVNTQKLG